MQNILTKITNSFSGDILFLVVLFVFIFLVVTYLGRNKAVSLILSFYPTKILYENLPFAEKFRILEGQYGQIINDLVIFFVLFILINTAINNYFNSYKTSLSLFGKAFLSLAFIIILLLLYYSVVNLNIFYDFSPFLDGLFNGAGKIFVWHIILFIILFFV